MEVFHSVWSERCLLFWRGLMRRADHSKRRARRPIRHKELLEFQRARIVAGTVAALRDATIAAVCFYGIRRSAAALALDLADVNLECDCFRILISKQKNDPDGHGMACWLPTIPSLDDL